MDIGIRAGKESGTLRGRLAAAFAEQIEQLPPGTRLPTLRELQKKMRCSRTTADHVVDVLETRGLLVRRPRQGLFAATGKVRSVYFLMPCPPEVHKFDPLPFNTAAREAALCGVEFVPIWISRTNNPEAIDWENVRRIPAGAAVIVHSVWYYRVFDFLNKRQANVAFIDQQAEWANTLVAQTADWLRIVQPQRDKVRAAVDYLVERGCRKILFLHGCEHEDMPSWAAFRSALRRAGLRYSPKLVLHISWRVAESLPILRAFARLGYKYDGVLATEVGRAWAANELRRLCEKHQALPITCCGRRLSSSKLPPGVPGFDVNDARANAEAVRLLASGAHGPRRVDVPYLFIPPCEES